MNQVSERKPNQEKVIAHPLEQEGVLKLERKVTQTLSSTPRVSISYYDSLSAPMRVLLYIPLTIQCHTFPTVLFTEGYHVFRQNFGFSSHKLAYSLVAAGLIYLESPEALVRNLFLGGVLIAISSPSFETRINNLCLYGMFLCTISKLYVNPWYDEKNEKVHAIWFNITDKTIPDTDYHTSFNTALWNFSKAVCVQVLTYVLNDIFSSLLNQAITFKRQYEFVKEWLSNDAAYGVKSGNQSSGAEEDNEKANLNPVQLFEDINNHNRILSLWNYRINSITDCYTATCALFSMSPLIPLSFYFGTVHLPWLLVISVLFSVSYNALLTLFEAPAKYFFQKMNQLKDRIISQITNIDNDINAELIMFLEGEDFEGEKLLSLLREMRKQSINYSFLGSGKYLLLNFIHSFSWLLPIIATMESVREGIVKREAINSCMNHYERINSCITWGKNNFDMLNPIEQSARRLALYEERIQAWGAKRIEIEKKVFDSHVISFSGYIFEDEKHEKLLAKGSFTLEPGSITHIHAPSGSGKTTLFRTFRRVWNEFDGVCTVPKEKTAFLPCEPYVLGPDEPLFQTICYPVNYKELTSNIELIKSWIRPLTPDEEKNDPITLNLPERVYNNLMNLRLSDDETANKDTTFKWATSLSPGQRKRLAFCNILLKLKTQDIEFLILDEPFKGIDSKMQAFMTKLLKNVIDDYNPNCTVLFANHEQNHGLNTHTLTFDEREYKLERC